MATRGPWPVMVMVCLLGAAVAAAQDEAYRERQVLDPETGEWIDQPAPLPTEPEGALELARSHLARNEPNQARGLLEDWLEANPDHERRVEATFLLGEAEFLAGRFYQAYENYEYVVENSSGDLFYRALRREMDVARAFLSGEERIVWGFIRLPAQDDGIEILDRVWERVPGTRLGEDALRLIADYRFAVGDFDLAQDEYARLVREYPNGRHSAHAMLRAAEAAEAAFGGVEFDSRPLIEAEVRYRQFLAAYPAYAREEAVPGRLNAIELKRAEKDYHIAQWYEKTKHPEAAAFYYRMINRDWPDSLQATLSRQRLEALGQPLEPTELPPADAPTAPRAPDEPVPTTNPAAEAGG